MCSKCRTCDKKLHYRDAQKVRLYVILSLFLATLSGALATSPVNSTTTLQNSATVTPEPELSIIDLFSNVTLRKCQCEKDQVWDGNQCLSKYTLVPVYIIPQAHPYLLNTSDFNEANVAVPECPDNHALISLDFSSDSHFFLMNNGNLLWENEAMAIEDYCFEFALQDDGNVMTEVSVCLYLSVPQCCPSGYLIDSDGSCLPDDDHPSFAPPVTVAMREVHWEGGPEDIRNKTCSGIEEVTQISLNEENNLFYSTLYHHYAPLAWKPTNGPPGKLKVAMDYCVGMKRHSESGQLEYIAEVCYVDPKLQHQAMCNNATCVRKCCEENQLLYGVHCIGATSADDIWKPVFYDPTNSKAVASPPEDLVIIYGWPLCEDFHSMNPNASESDKIYLMANGHLDDFLGNFNLPPTDYCVDLALDPITSMPVSFALMCPSKENDACQWAQTLNVVLSGVSFLFLAATLIIYLGVPDLRDRSNGRCLMSMISAMMSAHVCLTVLREVPDVSDTQCIITAFVCHVSILATFFWLNVMCFDMWSTLRSSQQHHHSLKVFGLYSLYAWGVPLLVGIIAVVLDALELPGVIRPRFLLHSCWFWRDTEFWTYQGGIILFLVVVNLFFFIHVAVILAYKLKQRKRMFETGSSHNKSTNSKKQAWLFLKLFIVMGVLWIAETLSSISHRRTCSYWLLSDIINSLQGVFIFLVAVCNRDNIKKIQSSWHPRLHSIRRTLTRRESATITKTRTTDLSMITSYDSRKTSVTSLPRKLSAVSQVFFTTGNKGKGTTGLGENTEAVRSSIDRSPSPRKASSVSNHEIIPMSNIKE